jgi:hypothetical protein
MRRIVLRVGAKLFDRLDDTWFYPGAGAGLALPSAPTSAHERDVAVPTPTGFASLPALTFVPGSEPSGAALGTAPVNGISAPRDYQPERTIRGGQRGPGLLRRGA